MDARSSIVQVQVFTEEEVSGLSSSERVDLANRAIESIVSNTESGFDKHGNALHYAPDSPFEGQNLFVTGDLLTSIQIIDTTNGIKVGYTDMKSTAALKADGHITGGDGAHEYKKDFLGLPSESKATLLMEELSPEGRATTAFLNKLFPPQAAEAIQSSDNDITARFLENLFNGQR